MRPPMTPINLMLCLRYLHAAEDVLLAAEDWAAAAHLSLVIDRVRSSYGLPERPVDAQEYARWREPRAPAG